ncbi:hypothetical protein BG004_008180 [Podila humilis]|nr:hypothetical protein BG004_008180 [Podila humilis]
MATKLTAHDSEATVPASDTSAAFDFQELYKKAAARDERELALAAVVCGLVVVRLLLPQISFAHVIIGTLGMGMGGFGVAFYLLSVPEHIRIKRASTMAKFGTHSGHSYLHDMLPDSSAKADTTEPKVESSQGIHLTESNDDVHDRVQISPVIDPMIETMITYTLRDFVNVPVGLVPDGHHNIPLRISLVAMAMNMAKRLRNMRLPETVLLAVFGLQNSFIVHLRAYRELRASRLPIDSYVSNHANADSVLGRCYHKEERLKQFRSIARAMCQSLLSKNDQQSIALFAVMQEIMANKVLESTLEHMCDPDFINLTIIDYFNTSNEPSKTDSNELSGQLTHNSMHSSDAPISSLADSILMSAATLLDKSGQGSQGSNTSLGNKGLTRQSSSTSISSLNTAPITPSIAQGPTFGVTKPSNSFLSIPNQPIGLKQVLTNKTEHMDIFQEFMDYLQVWDAMDLAEFWLMIDIFHRQIEQGALSDRDDLHREANNIFLTYCGPDTDSNVAGIRDAKGGTLMKNLKKSIQRDPSISFREAHEWAFSVLEAQYWVPFEIKKAASSVPKQKESVKSKIPLSSPLVESTTLQKPTNASSGDSAVDLSPTMNHSPTEAHSTIPRAKDEDQQQVAQITTAVQPRNGYPVVQSIHVSDMVHVRPKTLMSNADLSYMVEIQTEGGQGWMVTRTFQQIEQLQQALVQQFPMVQRTVFPRWRLQPSDKVCNGLQAFLRAMLAIPEVHESTKLAWFLSKEYDLNPDGTVYDHGLNRKNSMGFGSAVNLLEQSKALGMASQGAKSALRQASEASLSAGRFFKSLGGNSNGSNGAVNQLAEEKSTRGSFESTRSTSSTIASLPEHGAAHPIYPSPPMQRIQGESLAIETHSRASSSSESVRTRVGPGQEPGMLSPIPQTSDLGCGSPALSNGTSTPLRKSQELGGTMDPSMLATCGARSFDTAVSETDQKSNTESGISVTSQEQQQQQQQSPAQLPSSLAPPPSSAPSTATTTTTTAAAATTSTPKNIKKVTLLSNDELDLLIETSFTVLEDMMDFSKGQSIRRMTFGMLRELVRKSYRIAINQSFSEWVEMNTSAEKAEELVQWMKDDILWPGGEWPVIPTPPPAATTTTSSTTAAPALRTQQEKDATRDQARELVKIMLPGSLVTVLGREAVLRGLVDVFEMFQIKELNLGLALSVFEMAVRLVLTR